MKVTRDVVFDLLPLVEAGEASADSKALVEEFLREHKEYSGLATAHKQAIALADQGTEPPPELEARVLKRTKRLIALRSWLIGLGTFLLFLPMSTYHSSKTIDGKEVWQTKWLMLRDSPELAVVSVCLGICCWVAWFLLRRRLRATAL